MREKDYSTQARWGVQKQNVVQRTTFQFRVYNKTLNKKKAERSTERKSAEEDKEEENQTTTKYGEHTIRPVALVGGVGVRPRRF